MAVFDHFKKSTGNLLRSDQIGDKDLIWYSIYFYKKHTEYYFRKTRKEDRDGIHFPGNDRIVLSGYQ